MNTIDDIPVGQTAWMVLHNDGSDYGRATTVFTTEQAMAKYVDRLRSAGPQGNYFHPAPERLRLRVFEVTHHAAAPEWVDSPDAVRED